jgi:hypothetical protein
LKLAKPVKAAAIRIAGDAATPVSLAELAAY